MAASFEYKCSTCNREVGRESLVVKKATFAEMGEGGRVIRSRVVGWLCTPCLNEDAQYSLPKFKFHDREKV